MSITKWFSGLRGKMTTIVVLSIAILVVINLVVLFQIKVVSKDIDAITDIRMPSIKGLTEIDAAESAIMELLALIQSEQNPARIKTLLGEFKAKREHIKDGRDLYDPLPQSPDETIEFEKNFAPAWKEFNADLDAYANAVENLDRTQIQKYHDKLQNSSEPAEASLQKIIAINYKNADEDRARAKDEIHQMRNVSLGISIAGAFLTALFSFLMANRIAKVLSALSQRLDGTSSMVASASTQLAQSAQELSSATTEQAASLQETAASLEEISAMITKAADSASDTAESAGDSQTSARDGKAAVADVLNSMSDISTANEAIMAQITDSNQKMTEIVQVIQEIGNKTRVINEIVFQTKLLSFNASVEAARAGEHGKGFAVVAEEVGNLAQMSGNAARDITGMLESSTKRVDAIVQETKAKVQLLAEQSRMKIQNGVGVAQKCSTALDQIVGNVERVSQLAAQISEATKEQSQGVGEITKAMAQLDTVTQQNTTSSHNAAGAADSLSSQAESLRSAVNELTVTIEGNAAQPETHKTPPPPPVAIERIQPVQATTPKRTHLKMASGAPAMPDRNDSGFEDV